MALEILGSPIITDQRLVIDVDKIGIKTSSPKTEFEVFGDAFISGTLNANNVVGTISTATNVVGGNANVVNLTVSASADVPSISGTILTYSTGRFTSLNSSIGIITNLSGTNLNYLGIGTVGSLNVDTDLSINGTVSLGSSTGDNGQYLKSTGTGVEWGTFPTARVEYTVTASEGQTGFTTSYNVGFLDVFINGVKLDSSDYVATDGSNITLVEPTFENDTVNIVSYATLATGGSASSGGGGGGGNNDDGSTLTLGNPTDQDLVNPGALNTFTTTTKIVDSIDDLNELALNMMKNTAVSDLDFSTSPVAGGSPFSITLATSAAGNPNTYYIDWGDGNIETTSDSTPSHTYVEENGGQFSISMTASNSSGVGAGSSFTKSKSNYITVYTPDPVVSFNLYRNSTGGDLLSGNDLYVIEGQSLYLDNNTTNTSVGAGVTYTINWGDGSTNGEISSDTVGGGASTTAPRLQHTWGQGTNSSTSLDTLTLTLNSHITADPSTIPTSGTVSLKVYDDSPTEPDGLSSKTISNVSSSGVSPKLASGFTDNVSGGTNLSVGDTVNRVISGTVTAGPIGTYAYSANGGTLTANVNGSPDGSKAFTSGDDSGTYGSLIIDSESDYQLLNSGGSSTTFSNSVYYPGLYKGFKARVSKSVSSLSVGANSMELSHSVTGNTNIVEFIKDDLTVVPTVNIGSASLTESSGGTKRYISGIPYYNTGSPTLTLSGVTVDNLVGQCYTNQSNIVEVDTGSNQEGTTDSATVDSDYTYSQIDGAVTMLSGGVPIANTGTSSSYSIGNLSIPINSSNVRTIDRIKVRARNVNGVSNYTNDISTNIQVHTASQSGISEISIQTSSNLGDGTYTDNAKRIFDFSGSTSNNPSYNSATNFYTNNPYSESSDPGVSGTKEATVRLGVLKYDVTDYSTGYLPSGPDRSGDTGTQYFTFAFRRRVVSNFDISITSSTGISGVWIAAPGTGIDNTSGLNGWLRSDTTYAGSGVPGSNPGGNGSDGCAFTSGDRILTSTALSGSYTMTLGSENMSNATGNVVLVRIALTSGQSITSLSIGEPV